MFTETLLKSFYMCCFLNKGIIINWVWLCREGPDDEFRFINFVDEDLHVLAHLLGANTKAVHPQTSVFFFYVELS